MGFDFAAEQPKLIQLLIGLIAFVAVIALLFFVVDPQAWLPRQWRSFRERKAAQELKPPPHPPKQASTSRTAVRKARWLERWQIFVFLGPAGLLVTIGLVVPAIRTTVLSFFDSDGTKWVGVDNYVWMFDRPETRTVLQNTLIWVLLVPTVATAVGLVYAILVDRSRFEALAKSLIFMPMAISFVGAGIIWKFVYAYRQAGEDQIGLLNQVMVWLGLEPRQWLLNPPLNTLLLLVVMIWIQTGFATVVLSAAIKAIPTEIVEAARLDGTNPWQMFWKVTLPSIRPAVVVVVVTISIATLKVFDIVRTMTGGNFDTSVIANEMYSQAFRYTETGHGSALAVFLFVLVLPIVIYQVRSLRRQRES